MLYDDGDGLCCCAAVHSQGVKELFPTGSSPMVVSFAASIAAALWRITITPMTTIKTMLQTEGTLDPLWKKLVRGGERKRRVFLKVEAALTPHPSITGTVSDDTHALLLLF